jgi:hypothetical protein
MYIQGLFIKIEFIIWINQTISFQVSIKSGPLEKGHFSLVRGLPPCVGEIKFGTWKANMEVVIRGTCDA